LPSTPYEIADWVYNHKVNIDCHVAFNTNRYSVPFNYVGKTVDVKAGESLIEIFHKDERIASHKRIPNYRRYQWSTIADHMPEQFNKVEWTDVRIKKWAYSIGIHTGDVIDRIFDSVRIKEQAYNSCLSVLRLSKPYTDERLEIACEIALTKLRSPRYRNLKPILSSNQDKIYQAKKDTHNKHSEISEKQGYVRGPEYYGGGDES